MHTTIIKTTPQPGCAYPVNDDGMVWRTEPPNIEISMLQKLKYHASIPDSRIEHAIFESFGWHHSWAETIEELIDDIKSFNVPYYSEDKFLNMIIDRDKNDSTNDRQIELHWDGRGAKITRGDITVNNMTAYTSL